MFLVPFFREFTCRPRTGLLTDKYQVRIILKHNYCVLMMVNNDMFG